MKSEAYSNSDGDQRAVLVYNNPLGNAEDQEFCAFSYKATIRTRKARTRQRWSPNVPSVVTYVIHAPPEYIRLQGNPKVGCTSVSMLGHQVLMDFPWLRTGYAELKDHLNAEAPNLESPAGKLCRTILLPLLKF